MSNQASSRFTPQNQTTHQRLSTNTVGLVALSDFRKRRAEVLEQQEREARDAASGTSTPTPDRSLTGTPDNAGSDSGGGSGLPVKKKKKKIGGTKLSFGDEDEDEDKVLEDGRSNGAVKGKKGREIDPDASDSKNEKKSKITVNKSVSIIPKSSTKAALRREAAEREALRRDFLALQEAVKATEVAIPFVFYDGTNIPGGTVRVRKGDFVWLFLDKSRKVGAELGVGEKANARREWARVGVDDLMLVRGTIIIPHHYEFYFFIMNKSCGPGGKRLFAYSAEAPTRELTPTSDVTSQAQLTTPGSNAASSAKVLPDISTLEGVGEDPTFTKVVDRRWYERNKHIYPASVWQDFDPEKDYTSEVRRDPGGNTFFSR